MAEGQLVRGLLAALAVLPAASTRAAPIAPTVPVAAAPACLPDGAGAETAGLVGVEERMVLRLADGRQLRLAGLDPAQGTPDAPGRAEEAGAALAAMIGGQPIRFTPLDGKPDRWGRRAVLASVGTPGGAAGASGERSLAEAAVAAGLGRYLAEPLAHPCRERLLRAEAAARAARAGLWADPFYAVLAPGDGALFAERSATTVVAAGRLAAVIPGPYRTELRFAAPDDGQGRRLTRLAVAIPPRAAKLFRSEGVALDPLVGREVRVRGLLDLRFGPRVELAGPDGLEVLASAGAP